MARDPRRDNRPGAGPGRGNPRARASQRPRQGATSARAGASTDAPPVEPPASMASRIDKGLTATHRIIALVVVLALLMLSYASSLRIYFNQQAQLSRQREELAASQLRIYQLQDHIQRWQDPNYVRAQARERLGWVVPGETGYVVLGPDGRPIDGSTQITQHRGLDDEGAMTWWQRLWDTVVVADQPTDADPVPTGKHSATPRPTPSRIEESPELSAAPATPSAATPAPTATRS